MNYDAGNYGKVYFIIKPIYLNRNELVPLVIIEGTFIILHIPVVRGSTKLITSKTAGMS